MFDQLYSELILEHSKTPKNYADSPQGQCFESLENPLCGDQIEVAVSLDSGRISKIEFCGQGCSISKAAASMMTQLVQGMKIEEFSEVMQDFGAYLQNKLTDEQSQQFEARAGDLVAFQGVKKFPIRAKCALLGFEAVNRAIAKHLESNK